MVATADAYVLSPDLLGDVGADPNRTHRLSSRYLVAIGARLVREVAALARGAESQNKKLATLAIDTEIKFANATDQQRFTEELVAAIAEIAARYHQEQAPKGRWHRLIVAAHPVPKDNK
jgi:hypothetical protein